MTGDMHLWKISQITNNDYDEYDSAIVAAEFAWQAKSIRPDGDECKEEMTTYDSWVGRKDVIITLIGIACPGTKRGVILASFNAR